MYSRTPDDVKKGLACAGLHTCPDEKCPYYASCAPCELQVQDDALALIYQLQADNAGQAKTIMWMEAERDDLKRYIQQLEAQNAELLKKTEQLQAERDAAIENIRGDCVYCLHLCEDMVAPSCFDCANKGYYRWEWRGLQKEG